MTAILARIIQWSSKEGLNIEKVALAKKWLCLIHRVTVRWGLKKTLTAGAFSRGFIYTEFDPRDGFVLSLTINKLYYLD